MSNLHGEWNLVTWSRSATGKPLVFPFGENPSGLLIYTANKNMIVQMLLSDRALIGSTDPVGGSEAERANAYSGNLSYFGTYEIEGNDIVHEIIGSAYPNWSNTTQRRAYIIEGKSLTLKTKPAPDDPTQTINSMIWVKS